MAAESNKSLNLEGKNKQIPFMEGAVAEWSKALLLRGKINEKPKRSQVRPPAWATFLKKTPNIFGGCIALR